MEENMLIIDNPITLAELKELANRRQGDLVKGVVDIDKGILALGMELHRDGEAVLLERDSRQSDLWGINLYPDLARDEMLEFDSMINVRPPQNRSRSVDDTEVRNKITKIVNDLIRDE